MARSSFQIVGKIRDIQTIATRTGIHNLRGLEERHGSGRWLKRKGIATIRLPDGAIRRAELHWYEAHGIGRRGLKLKRYLDL